MDNDLIKIQEKKRNGSENRENGEKGTIYDL